MFRIKKTLSVIVAFILLLSAFTVAPITVSAETSGDYEYSVLKNSTVEITKYNGSESDLIIPSEIGNRKVTAIGDKAFLNCTSLKSITFSSGVTSIGNAAFRGCKYITSITIPDTVVSIEDYAFYACIRLKSIIIPESVTKVGDYAFFTCTDLSDITISNNDVSIGKAAFYNTSYYNDASNWENGVFYINQHLIVANTDISGDISIKSGVLTIANEAFHCCSKLTGVSIPESVGAIGKEAFLECPQLNSINIPKKVNNIGEKAFGYIKTGSLMDGTPRIEQLQNFTIKGYKNTEAENYAIGLGFQFVALGKVDVQPEAFKYVELADGTLEISGLENKFYSEVTIPSEINNKIVSRVGNNAFANRNTITELTITDSITRIGYSAFSGCTKLTSITLPDSVKKICKDAFLNTGYYNKSSNWEDGVLYINNHLIKAKSTILEEYSIKPGTVSVAEEAFYNLQNLKSVTIPKEVKEIGNMAFGYILTTGIKEDGMFIDIDNDFTISGYKNTEAENYSNSNGINFVSIGTVPIQNDAFEYQELDDGTIEINGLNKCYSDITIPSEINGKKVKSIGAEAFYNCTYLDSVIIGNNINCINQSAFYGCERLSSLTIPDSVTNIGEGAFWRCTSLSSVTIPDSVTNIGEGAFCRCTSLSSVTIPDSVTNIGFSAFDSKCTIYCNADSCAEFYAYYNFIKFVLINKRSIKKCKIETEHYYNGNFYNGKKSLTLTYTGKAIKLAFDVYYFSNKYNYTYDLNLNDNSDYTVSYKNNKNVGTATVTITGKGNYTGKITKTFKIAKANNPMIVKTIIKSVKLNKVTKTKQIVDPLTVKKAIGKVTYKKLSGSSKLTINSKGKVVVKKGTKKGTYKIKIKVTAKGHSNYKSCSKKVTLKVKIK